MALLALAVFDTEENKRSDYTYRTLYSLSETVDWKKHRLIVVDNGSCAATKDILRGCLGQLEGVKWGSTSVFYPYIPNIKVITNETNIGTAEAINLAWKERQAEENAIKMDNDVVVYKTGWVDEMEEAIKREPRIGQIALKRKDLAESPDAAAPHFRSKLTMLPHKGGEKWIVVEEVSHCMGTCVMHSSVLLDKVGYLFQNGPYGFDDSAMSFRSKLSGFINCFLSHIEIDHIDTGENPYSQEKVELAHKAWAAYQQLIQDYKTGKRSLYYSPFQK